MPTRIAAPEGVSLPEAYSWWDDAVVYGSFSLDSYDPDEEIDDELGAGPGT